MQLGVAAAVFVTLVSSAVHAQPFPQAAPRPSVWDDRPWAIEGVFGIATPVGAAGLWLDYSLASWLAVGTGFGTNFVGFEAAAMLRPRATLSGSKAVYAGMGGSLGQYMQDDTNKYGLVSIPGGKVSVVKRWDWAKWFNVEAGYERRGSRDLSLSRAFGGFAILATPTPDEVTVEEQPPPSGAMNVQEFLVYGGVAFGWSL